MGDGRGDSERVCVGHGVPSLNVSRLEYPGFGRQIQDKLLAELLDDLAGPVNAGHSLDDVRDLSEVDPAHHRPG